MKNTKIDDEKNIEYTKVIDFANDSKIDDTSLLIHSDVKMYDEKDYSKYSIKNFSRIKIQLWLTLLTVVFLGVSSILIYVSLYTPKIAILKKILLISFGIIGITCLITILWFWIKGIKKIKSNINWSVSTKNKKWKIIFWPLFKF